MARRPVEITWEALKSGEDISSLLQEGFGPDGLGIVTVSGVPGFPRLRERLLPLAAAVAALPDADKSRLEDPASNYNVGWSHGKEALEGGRLDKLKGSFYANPCRDTYDDLSASDVEKYRDYYTANLWPRDALPALEPALKGLGGLMVDVGLLLADRCSDYVASQLPAAAAPARGARDAARRRRGGAAEGDQGAAAAAAAAAGARECPDFGAALRESACHRARLLHYFPPPAPAAGHGGAGAGPAAGGGADWCGWHFDHGALTALTCAMYLGPDGEPCANPDPAGGLYIRDRAGAVVQAAIPQGYIAFQMGQAMAIQSGGLLHATPHFVRAARPDLARGVSRNTFAVFLQPDASYVMRAPRVTSAADAEIAGAGVAAAAAAAAPLKLTAQESAGWREGQTFGAFAAELMGGYYDAARRQEREQQQGAARDGSSGGGGGGSDSGGGARRQTVVLHVEAE